MAASERLPSACGRLASRGRKSPINGRPIFIRGTLECAVFPLTGYPPTDVAWWQRVCRIIKSYGLNALRFHSWCPPDAAFAAADIEGIMIQAEGPQANVNAGEDAACDAFTQQELLRIVRTYGQHPSFCLMTLGNEYGGNDLLLSHWVDMLMKEDPRRLYSSASCGQTTKNRQFTVAAVRGIRGPGTDHDFGERIAKVDRPLISHEIGQWTFFPSFSEMKKYTGVLQPRNFEIVRNSLQAKGMLDLAPQFYETWGKQAVLLYKEEIEVLLRTPNHAGFELLDLHDYPSQGTAIVGPLDAFWDSKGFVTPEQHRRYCGPTVPLLRMKKRTFTAGRSIRGDHRRGALRTARPCRRAATVEHSRLAGPGNRRRQASHPDDTDRQAYPAGRHPHIAGERRGALQADGHGFARRHAVCQRLGHLGLSGSPGVFPSPSALPCADNGTMPTARWPRARRSRSSREK